MRAAGHLSDGLIDTGVNTQRQAITCGINLTYQFVEIVAAVAHHMQHRTKDLFFQLVHTLQLNQRWHHKSAGSPFTGIKGIFMGRLEHRATFLAHCLNMFLNILFGFAVNHRTDIRCQTSRVTHATFRHRAAQHSEGMFGNLFLQAEYAQCRTALSGAIKGRGEHIDHHLLGQRRRVDNHCIQPACFGDKRRWTPLCIQSCGNIAL